MFFDFWNWHTIFHISIYSTIFIFLGTLFYRYFRVINKREINTKLPRDPLVFGFVYLSWILWTFAFSIVLFFSPHVLFESNSFINLYALLPKYLHSWVILIASVISIIVGLVISFILIRKLYSKCDLGGKGIFRTKIIINILCIVCMFLFLTIIIGNILCVTEPSYLELNVNMCMLTPILLPIATFLLLLPLYFIRGGERK